MRHLTGLLIGTLFAFGPTSATPNAPAPRIAAASVFETRTLAPLRALLATPEAHLDFARAKLVVDQQIDPEIDVSATLEQLDALANAIHARFPAGATDAVKMELLLASLHQPGPWNDHRPFRYDLDDPFGDDIRNKLLATYLDSRKGNCVSMPALVVILGQRLGLKIALAAAPQHFLAKFHNPHDGQWVNVEATSGGFKRDSSCQRELGISPLAMHTGIYLRPLGKREAVAAMMSTLMEFYGKQGLQDQRIAVADLALAVDPRSVTAMLEKGTAYYGMIQQRYITKFRSPADLSVDQLRDYEELRRSNLLWFERAEALGWTEPAPGERENYLKTIQRTKDALHGGQ